MKRVSAAIGIVLLLALGTSAPSLAGSPRSEATVSVSFSGGPDGCTATITSSKGISHIVVDGSKTEFHTELLTLTVQVEHGDSILVKSGTTRASFTAACDDTGAGDGEEYAL